VRLFRGEDLAPAATVRLGADADNVRWVGATKRLWVAHGEGALAAIDPAKPDEPAAAVPLDVHPEGFQVDAAGGRAFVNQAARAEVAVCDLAARKVTARWPLGGPTKNYPMALDEAAKRLWIGCRAPAKLVVLSTEDGAIVASLDCAGDPDDVFVDAANRRAYVVCGEGSVDVADFAGEAPRRTGRVATRKGARTGLLDDGRLWVAVPATDAAEAEIREFEPLPR
jgi:DNA-binding beta-propeller fold protein YncE